MARKRMIDPKFWSDDKMMGLTPMHRLLFIGIWNFSDDGGIHKNNDSMLKAEIFPCDDITIEEVGKMKEKLMQLELIVPFEHQGIELFYIKNWKIYQSISKPIPSKYELPEDSRKTPGALPPNRIERNGIEKKRVESNNTHTTIDLNTLATKYPTINVEPLYETFRLKQMGNDKKSVNEAADFEIWCIRALENGWNLKPQEGKNAITNKVTLHCPKCRKSKEVTAKEKVGGVFCCEEQMVEEYELTLIKKE